MMILFGLSTDHRRIDSVYWMDGAKVKGKIMLSDGSVESDNPGWCDNLRCVADRLGGAYSPFEPRYIDDYRSALQYLGKSADLIDLLPEADFEDDGIILKNR